MTVSPDFTAYEARMAALSALQMQALPMNKTALFDALAKAGITQVVVQFDGYGDSGQIEGTEARTADENCVALPTMPIALHAVNGRNMTIVARPQTPTDVIEIMTYDLLERRHGDWGNDDGGSGEMRFDVADRSITLDYNERMTSYTHHVDTF
jgi:hypothetical protein